MFCLAFELSASFFDLGTLNIFQKVRIYKNALIEYRNFYFSIKTT